MAGTDDDFNSPKLPKLELPADFVQRLNLPPDAMERLRALVPPGLAQKLQQLARSNRSLTPDLRDMIALVLEKRRDIQQLEAWLDDQIDRERWDPAARAAPSTATPAPPAPTPELPSPAPNPLAAEQLLPETEEGAAQQIIAEAVLKIYPDGKLPSDIRPADLRRKIENAIGKRNVVSWPSCKRFIEKHRNSSD
jgi:hypothetical protein